MCKFYFDIWKRIQFIQFSKDKKLILNPTIENLLLLTFFGFVFFRKVLETNGNKSHLCWWRFYKKTTKVWTLYQAYGLFIFILMHLNGFILYFHFSSFCLISKLFFFLFWIKVNFDSYYDYSIIVFTGSSFQKSSCHSSGGRKKLLLLLHKLIYLFRFKSFSLLSNIFFSWKSKKVHM